MRLFIITLAAFTGIVLSASAEPVDQSWWSLQPLAEPSLPEEDEISDEWRVSAIDRLVYASLLEKRLTPNPPAEPTDLIRRMTFDVTGLPPSPEESAAFVTACETDRKGATDDLIERLLASPQYGERWGRHWLDVVRFGESNGYERNVLTPNLWPFRDYVIRSLNEDKPFDQFIKEHLAGDVFGAGDPKTELATAFLVSGPYDNVGNSDAEAAARIRADTIDEMIRSTSEAFLGLTVGCARCHDHKFDPVPTDDYYRMYAIFAGVTHGERALNSANYQKQQQTLLSSLNAKREERLKERVTIEEVIIQRAKEALPQEIQYSKPSIDRYGTEDHFDDSPARFIRLKILASEYNAQSSAGSRIDEFQIFTVGPEPRNVALAAAGATIDAEQGRIAADFEGAYAPELMIDGEYGPFWIAGESAEFTVALKQTETINRVRFSSDGERTLPPENGERAFVGDYKILISNDGDEWKEVADSSRERPPKNGAFQRQRHIHGYATPAEIDAIARVNGKLAEIDEEIESVPTAPVVWAGNFHQPERSYVMKGGDPARRMNDIAPGGLRVLDQVLPPADLDFDADEASRRVMFAGWITDPENPLTPRVLANRIWHYHFGTGIVDTPSDFGSLGSLPTHPALLDYLARQLMAHEWRLKPIHREILSSRTYQQSSDFREEAAEVDSESRYLWRFPPRRLSAEELRDAMLATAGELDRTMGGPGFQLYHYLEDNVATYIPKEEHGPETYRRAVYHQNARAAGVDLLTDFDQPDCAFGAPRRASTTTPLQALTLMNHQFTLEMSDSVIEDTTDVAALWRRMLNREPTPEERDQANSLVAKYGHRALARALFNTSEFLMIK